MLTAAVAVALRRTRTRHRPGDGLPRRRLLDVSGSSRRAATSPKQALELAQRLGADDSRPGQPVQLAGIALGVRGRRHEAIAHFREALRLARVPRGRDRWSSAPRATSATPSCATTPTRAWSTPCAGRSWPGRSGRGTSWASACSTRSCACSASASGTAPPRWSTSAIEDDGLGDFADAARAAAVVTGTARRRDASAREVAARWTRATTRDPQELAYHAYAARRRVRRRGRRRRGPPPRSGAPRRCVPAPTHGPLRPRLAPGRRGSAARAGRPRGSRRGPRRCWTAATTARSR